MLWLIVVYSITLDIADHDRQVLHEAWADPEGVQWNGCSNPPFRKKYFILMGIFGEILQISLFLLKITQTKPYPFLKFCIKHRRKILRF